MEAVRSSLSDQGVLQVIFACCINLHSCICGFQVEAPKRDAIQSGRPIPIEHASSSKQ